VLWIREVARGSGDDAVLARAQAEARLLVTFDKTLASSFSGVEARRPAASFSSGSVNRRRASWPDGWRRSWRPSPVGGPLRRRGRTRHSAAPTAVTSCERSEPRMNGMARIPKRPAKPPALTPAQRAEDEEIMRFCHAAAVRLCQMLDREEARPAAPGITARPPDADVPGAWHP